MPIHDWRCADCGAEILDRYQPRLDDSAPECPRAGTAHLVREDGSEIGWIPLYVTGAVDLTPTTLIPPAHSMERLWSTNRSRRTFEAFSVVDEVTGKTVVIESMKSLRDYERQTETYARDGVGRKIAFRHYSQDPGNITHNTFGPTPHPQFSTRTRRGRRLVIRRSAHRE